MNRKHAANKQANMTLCGYTCTHGEYRVMLRSNHEFVNCKRCLERLK